MSRKQIVLLVVVAAALAVVVLLARRNRQPPLLPSDADHGSYSGPDACLKCHGPDAPYPRSLSHPNGFDCVRCHGSR